jgi:hypothetical protein
MGAVGTSIIYSIGAVGSSATVAKFAAVGAAIFVGVKAIDELTESSEKYQRLIKNIRTDMSEYNKETKGLIDTQAGLEGVIRAQNAGIELGGKQLAAFGKAAVDLNQKLGNGPGGATQIFEQLTKGLSKGTGRAFKELGIDIENTEDLLLAQAEILEKVTAKYGELSVEVETSREAWFQFGNNLGTVVDQEIAVLMQSSLLKDAILALSEPLGQQAELWERTGGMLSNMTNRMKLFQGVLATTAVNFGIANEATLAWSLQAQRLIQDLEGVTKAAKETQKVAPDIFDLAPKLGPIDPKDITKPKRTGGRGRRKRPGETDLGTATFQRDDLGSVAFETEPIFFEENLIEIEERKKTNEELWQIELEQEERQRMLAIERQEFRNEMLGIEQARQISHMEAMLGIEQQGIDASFMQWQSGLQGRLELFRGFFGQLSVLQQSQSKAAFAIGKAAAISEAVISGVLGAQKSFTAMAGIPYVGPALGAIAAAAALAGMAINVQKIARTKFGQAAGVSSGGGEFGAVSQSAPSGPLGPGAGGGGGTTVIQLNLDGEQIQEAVVNSNDNAVQQGRPGFAQAS